MKTAIVTGCSRGIGRAITEMLLTDGWEVLGIARTMPERFEHDTRFAFLAWDLGHNAATYEQPTSLTGDGPYHPSNVLRDTLGGYDALVHCAGIRGQYALFSESDPEVWEQTIATNLLGTHRIVRAALPLLQRSPDGRILLMSGGGAFGPSPKYSAYAVSKAGIVSLMETMALELTDSTVTVNCVAPGFVATDIHRGTPHEGQDDHGAMRRAVACVRHLLGPQAYGLSGRTVSAQHDDWQHLTPWTIPHLGDGGTRTRHLMSGLERKLIRARRAI